VLFRLCARSLCDRRRLITWSPCRVSQPKIAAPKLTKPSAADGKKAQNVYTIDCTKPAEDRIFDVAGFEKYLHDNMKVDGKPGQLGSLVEIKRVGTSSFCPRDSQSPPPAPLHPTPLQRIKPYHAPLSRLTPVERRYGWLAIASTPSSPNLVFGHVVCRKRQVLSPLVHPSGW